jgi:demethylphylloquinone reductase
MVTIGILGGGFAGLYTALKLYRCPWGDQPPQIILVDKSDRFVFTPLLYELLTGEMASWEVAPQFRDLLKGTGVEFRPAAVESIALGDRRVGLSDGSTLAYDYLVLALGGETPNLGIPGVATEAIPFRTLEDVARVEGKLQALEASDLEKIRIAVVGGGYSGVELACKLADRLGERGRLRLVEMGTQILQRSPEFNRQAASQALSERRVWIDLETAVTTVTADSISLRYKEEIDTIPVDLVLWTVGNGVNPQVAALDLPRNDRGQLLTEATLQTITHPEVLALGDLATIQSTEEPALPATAQVALQQADFAAWNLWAMVEGKTLLPFRYTDLGEMMALGNNNATLTGLGLQLDGPLAYLTRRLVYLYRLPTLEHQVQVGLNWATRPIAQLLSQWSAS